MNKPELTKEELASFCLALQHLIHGGIAPADGLALLAQDETDPRLGQRLASMAAGGDDGLPLSEILRQDGGFPDYLCSLLAVGEQTGRLEEALAALAQYYQNRARLERQLRAALCYPTVLALVLLAVVAVLLMWVLPVFDDAYRQLGSSLTGLAGALLALGNGLRRTLPLWGGLLVLLALGTFAMLTLPQLRAGAVAFWQKHWGHRELQQRVNQARLAQALTMCLQAGLSVQEALSLSATLLDPASAFQAHCQHSLILLEEGKSLPQALGDSQVLSRADCRLLEAGFRSGSGEQVMDTIAQRLLEDSETALERAAAQVEPVLVVLLALLVGGILLSVMLPLMNILSAIG